MLPAHIYRVRDPSLPQQALQPLTLRDTVECVIPDCAAQAHEAIAQAHTIAHCGQKATIRLLRETNIGCPLLLLCQMNKITKKKPTLRILILNGTEFACTD